MAGGVCPSCSTENPERARFCMSCGTALAPTCPSCGAENPPEAKFCIECGTSLAAEPKPAQSAAATPAPATAAKSEAAHVPSGPFAQATEAAEHAEELPEERRKATVLFADLSGYTAVAENMDAEDVKSLIDRALRRLGQEVVRFGGRVDKYIGDNVMAVFGAPIAHEDDPERAVRAGLAMQSAMKEINEQLTADAGVSFELRVGINSGEVLAGQVGDEYTVMGDPVNVASRIQSAARPGSVTVGPVTQRLTRAAVEYEELEPLELKGKSEPVPAWEAIQVLVPGATRRQARAETPLIGRDDEWGLLESLYERVVSEGRPHLVTVLGPAGVGKSRLLRELVTKLGNRPEQPALREGRCPAYGAAISYWALGEIMREQFEVLDTDDSDAAWAKLRGGIEDLLSDETDEPHERIAALIARPLGVEPPPDIAASAIPENEDPQQTRDRMFSAVRSVVEAGSRRRPVVLAIEDIHWADEGMLDLIEYLARWVRGPVLIVCLTRDELLERRPGWGGGRRNATAIALEPLTDDEAALLVTALMGEKSGNGDQGRIVAQVARRSGGNPLFAEEMVNRIREEGASDAETLPDTVHSVLAARLDALRPAERRVLQHAAVVGETFWQGSLDSLAAEEGVDLGEALIALEEKDLVISRAGSRLAGEHEYVFKHALIRDVAYGTLPKSVRARKHAAVGRFIEEQSSERGEAAVALVAEHYGQAAALAPTANLDPGERDAVLRRAHQFGETAGDVAAGLYSNQEAFNRYSAVLALTEALDPESEARVGEKQGDIALRLGRVDTAVEVWERCLEYHRAEEDLARVGDLHRKIGAGLWHKGDREASIDHYQKGIDLLKDGPPCLELVRLYEEAASLYMHTGDNMLAIYASEKALRLAERLGEAAAASRAHGIFGRVFGRIGDSAKARENLERSVELARESDPGEAVRALLTLGYHLEVSEAEYEGAATAYSEALALSEQVGDLPSQVELHAALAQVAVHRADWEQVESSTSASTTLAEREGLTGKLCFPFVMRGILHWREGDWDGAVEICRRAHEIGEQVGRSEVAFSALFWLAAALRDSDDHGGAETALSQALDVCERAGLIAQSIEAISARAVTMALGGRMDGARDAAEEARNLAERLGYPVGKAAMAEAQGMTMEQATMGAEALAEARDGWLELGRPLDAARCVLLRGTRLSEVNTEASASAFRGAAATFEELGVRHLAERARELAPS